VGGLTPRWLLAPSRFEERVFLGSSWDNSRQQREAGADTLTIVSKKTIFISITVGKIISFAQITVRVKVEGAESGQKPLYEKSGS